MARKTLSQGVKPVHPATYADYPGCLPNYKWLVELALKNPEVMFNLPTVAGPSYCKCCGAAYHRKDYEAHVHEHAVQLKLRANGVAARVEEKATWPSGADDETPLPVDEPNEVFLTILDSLREKMPDLELDWTEVEEKIAEALLFDIALETEETEIGDAPLCDDCKEG